VTWLSTGRENLFSPMTGLADGILTALTLSTARLLHEPGARDLSLSLRVATATAVSGAFISFAGHYARLRGELVRAERQLNLSGRGRLASGALGRTVRREALQSALVSSGCAFAGAALPMLISLAVGAPAAALAAAVLSLVLLGLAVGHAVSGSPLGWALGMGAAGLALAAVGAALHLV
jgi:VIT1/CCC1 family predicted Fe2+/Mn2+ transporter